MSKFLWHWDSGNFALAIENYDISLDQPHPPGYIFYVGLGKLFNHFMHDANLSFVTVNIVFTILTALFVYKISWQLFSEAVARMSTLLLIFNPFTWFNSLVAVSYIGDAFFNTAIAYFCFRLIQTRSHKYLCLSAIVLGLSGGLRQSTIAFMFPLFLFSLYHARLGIKANISALFLCGIVGLTWLIPLLYECGGYSEYLNLLSGQVSKFSAQTSILFGATFSEHYASFWQLIKWTIVGSGFAILYFLVYVYKYKESIFYRLKANVKFYFFVIWICPSYLFYLFVHLGEPGYALSFVPATQILIGYFIATISVGAFSGNRFYILKQPALLLLGLPVVCYISYFLLFDPNSLIVKKFDSFPVANKLLNKINTMVQYHTIKEADALTRYYVEAIPQLAANEKQLAIVVFDGADWVWRIPMYYLPGYTCYRVATTYDDDSARFAVVSEGRVISPASPHSIDGKVLVDFDSTKKRILWLLPAQFKFYDLFSKTFNIKHVELAGRVLYVTDIDPGMGCREFGNMIFNFNIPVKNQNNFTRGHD
ncbi:MAG: DUF2723 domain-containing protein [candidate division KSB1 bacterium]|nr:DUF2723 domain-containing protein [candidate division KSB1 bacterium]MDZ7300901.1 DUF2723 domain-containing protein [candidate division KSB1 bacterium]MDZ7314053.1 DUF2723 domain-containing protein [candidate division KSB1 bacterium]